ncbi:MAG: hypothetical protein GXY15_14100 [Candidatus Hydrogenedentes bacterium]|nr:hypothetical protein [Candidatus Hydrogenedentota bacterium]
MSGEKSGKAQFSSLGLKLVAAAALAGILLLLFPAGFFLFTGGIQGILGARDALIPVSCAGMLCVPLLLSLRALRRGALSETDGDRLVMFIWPLTVLAVVVATMTVIIGGLLVAGIFL